MDDIYRDNTHTELTRRWLLLVHPLKLVTLENLEFAVALLLCSLMWNEACCLRSNGFVEKKITCLLVGAGQDSVPVSANVLRALRLFCFSARADRSKTKDQTPDP